MKQIVIMRASYGESFNQKKYEKEKRIAESAPELLEALLAICDSSPEKRAENWVELYQKARAAIAKAKGGKL